MTHRYLVLRMEAPMAAFGDVMIDGLGRIRETPSQSAVSGLLANALGIRREESHRLARLQQRLRFGCRIDNTADRFTDYQTAALRKADCWWSTSGALHERAGTSNTYASPHIRERDYDADVRMVLVLRLVPEDEPPTLDHIAHALDRPARPLFLGRKCCMPTCRLFDDFVHAESILAALRLPARSAPSPDDPRDGHRIVLSLPADGVRPDGFEEVTSTEERDWPAGVHAGLQRRYRALVPPGWLETKEAS